MDSPEATIPDCARHVWEWFWELRPLGSEGINGPLALSPTVIRDWSDRTGNTVTRQEYRMLMQMDGKYREAWAEEADNNAAMMREEANQE